jgi:hypothetical protein
MLILTPVLEEEEEAEKSRPMMKLVVRPTGISLMLTVTSVCMG